MDNYVPLNKLSMNTSSDKLLIYLTDDDEDDRFFFEEALMEISEPNEIVSFSNGVDLMASLHDRPGRLPDVIFIDLNMPLMNGEECIEDIRNEEKFESIPLVVYSTACDDDHLEHLKNMGANSYLQKPNTFPRLKEKLQTVLAKIVNGSGDGESEDEFIIS